MLTFQKFTEHRDNSVEGNFLVNGPGTIDYLQVKGKAIPSLYHRKKLTQNES